MRKPNLTDDYLIRLISQTIAAITRVLGLKSAGQYTNALQEINLTLESLLGIPWELLQNFTDNNLVDALTRGEQLDVDRALLAAQLYHQEGDVLQGMENPKAKFSYQRALMLYLQIVTTQGAQEYPEPVEEIKSIRKMIDTTDLSEEMMFSLFIYHEQVGQYGLADTVLEEMIKLPGLEAEIRDVREDFYRQLLEKPDEELNKNGMSRDFIEAQLNA